MAVSEKRELEIGLIISVILHLVGALAFFSSGSLDFDRFEAETERRTVVNVSLGDLPKNLIKAPQRQIISEPQSKVVKEAPENARFLAEQNRKAELEQIKRGVSPNAGSVGKAQSKPAGNKPAVPNQAKQSQPQKQSEQKEPSKQKEPIQKKAPGKQKQPAPAKQLEAANTQPLTAAKKAAPHKLDLSLNQDELLAKFGSGRSAKGKNGSSSNFSNNPAPQAFSRDAGSGAQFHGTTGVPDHIPGLPDGDLTLLNAKAEKFAVFVRRVALQVFAQIRAQGWEQLSARDIQQMNDFTTVRAILSRSGTLEKVTVEQSSGSRRFDQTLVYSAEKGAFDSNPPAAALNHEG